MTDSRHDNPLNLSQLNAPLSPAAPMYTIESVPDALYDVCVTLRNAQGHAKLQCIVDQADEAYIIAAYQIARQRPDLFVEARQVAKEFAICRRTGTISDHHHAVKQATRLMRLAQHPS